MESLDLGGNSNNIQKIAMKIIEDQIKQLNMENGPRERTVFVLGSKGVGKSGVINKFFDREENPRPTLALDYSFGRRSSQPQSIHKQILNVWELGNLDNSSQLIEVPFRSHGVKNFSVIAMVDLSQPNRIWADLETAINELKGAISRIATESNADLLKENYEKRIRQGHPDLSTMDIFALPLVIVGGKYDIFQDFDPEIKKHICRCLRSVAHHLGAALIFYSQKLSSLSKTVRDTFSHLGFGSPSHPFRKIITDYNEPLMIWFGLDSWHQIGVIPINIESIGIEFNLKIPQLKSGTCTIPEDPAKDHGFRESLIDEIRAQKDEELLALIRDTDVRNKFEAITTN